MENNKKKMILLCILVIVFILITVFLCFYLFGNTPTSNMLLVNEEKQSAVYDNDKKNSKIDDKKIDGNISDNLDDNLLTSDSNITDNLDDIVEDEVVNIKEFDNDNASDFSDENIVCYFENIENEVNESSSFKEKFRQYFITIVDFIFYDKEINGYTFNELSDAAKAKIISIALKIDSKIEEYVPNYKENISSTSNKIYTGIKDKLVILYMDVSTNICQNNEEECNKVKETFSEIKNVCKIGWNFIKGLFKNGYSKVKDWYEIYSGK